MEADHKIGNGRERPTGAEDWKQFQVEPGDYRVYWLGYNLDNRWPSEEQMELELEDYAELRDVERYEIMFVRHPCAGIGILKGKNYLNDERASA